MESTLKRRRSSSESSGHDTSLTEHDNSGKPQYKKHLTVRSRSLSRVHCVQHTLTSDNMSEAINMQVITDQINSLKTHFDSKLDGIKKDIKMNLAKELKSLREHVELEVGKCTSKIELLEARVTVLETAQSEPFDPRCSIIIFNMDLVANENDQSLKDAITGLIDDGMNNQNLTLCAERLPGRDDKTGIVKAQFGSKDQKVNVLRAKQALKKKPKYKNIFFRGAQTHAERSNYFNARTILK